MAFEESVGGTQPPGVAAPPARGMVPWGLADIGLALAVIIGGVIAISVPAAVVAAVVAGDVDADKDPAALAVVLGASLAMEGLMLMAAAVFSIGKYGASWADLGLRRPRRGGWWLPFALAGGGLTIVYAYAAALYAAGQETNGTVPEEAFDDPLPLILLAALALLFAPIMEEIFFRGFLFGGLRGRWGTLWAALASGALFGLAHLGNPETLYTVAPIAGVGILFAAGYAYSGSLFATMGAHFLFNALAFAFGLAS